MTDLKQQIITQVANGATNTRQIARVLDVPHTVIIGYFYETSRKSVERFVNGETLSWTPGKTNTLRLTGQQYAGKGRDENGREMAGYRVERLSDV